MSQPDLGPATHVFIWAWHASSGHVGAAFAPARQRQRRLLASLPEGAADTLIACLNRLQAEADHMLDELDAPSVSPTSVKSAGRMQRGKPPAATRSERG